MMHRSLNFNTIQLRHSFRITIRLLVLLPLVPFFSSWSAAATTVPDSTVPAAIDTMVPDTAGSASIISSAEAAPGANPTIATTIPADRNVAAGQHQKPSAAALDSIARMARRDSLLALETQRRSRYAPPNPDDMAHDTTVKISEGDLFRGDPVIWYDIPNIKRYVAGPKLGITQASNRLLLYGNTAPLDRRFFGTGLLYRRLTEPLDGDDATLTTEYGGLSFPGDGTLHFIPRSVGLVSPEISLYWETGVFDGNFLTVRFSRPLTRGLTLNVFSNYRYLKGMNFDHNNNDVYSFYSSLTRDSTLLSRNGYNPLVNEYFCGADACWSADRANVFFRVKYGDLVDEIPINRKPDGAFPDQMRIARYPLTFEGGVSSRSRGSLFFGAEALYGSDHQRKTYAFAEDTVRIPRSTAISSAGFSGAFRAGVRLPAGDSVSVQCLVRQRKITEGDSIEATMLDGRPELVWRRPFSVPLIRGSAVVRAGYNFYASGTSDAGRLPLLSGSFNTTLLGTTLNAYAERSIIEYAPVIDTTTITGAVYDDYYRTGVEIEREWPFFGLLVGYQFCRGIDSLAVGRAWLSGAAPYDQPQSSVVIAPRLGRWRGMTLSSRIMLSDSRPYFKVQSGVSLLAIPKLTRQTIDLRLGLDYWSERDPILFAGSTQWNRPVVDLNFGVSVHIKTFRLMYKIDNLLNRNFSYVPGWTAPGITFRWGFSWLIQR